MSKNKLSQVPGHSLFPGIQAFLTRCSRNSSSCSKRSPVSACAVLVPLWQLWRGIPTTLLFLVCLSFRHRELGKTEEKTTKENDQANVAHNLVPFPFHVIQVRTTSAPPCEPFPQALSHDSPTGTDELLRNWQLGLLDVPFLLSRICYNNFCGCFSIRNFVNSQHSGNL